MKLRKLKKVGGRGREREILNLIVKKEGEAVKSEVKSEQISEHSQLRVGCCLCLVGVRAYWLTICISIL